VIDQQSYLRMQNAIRREGRSFLQYAAESFPWTSPSQKSILDRLQGMVQDEQHAVAELSRLLVKNHLTPTSLGTYPAYFTSYNFLSLDKLIGLLITHQKSGIEAMQSDLDGLPNGQCSPLLLTILEKKKKHLDTLETLGASAKEQ
jgi:hypothetical protein